MSKFKEGDKVRFTEAYGLAANKGDTGVVLSDSDAHGNTRLRLDRNGASLAPYSFRLELIPSASALPGAKKTWIISVIIDGKLAPAPRPAEYVSAEQARAVARSMAEKNPGSTFVVFEAVGAAYVAPAPKADFVTL